MAELNLHKEEIMINKSTVEFAADGTAWKTTTMRGYIKKTVLDEATHGEKSFKLTFVKADGSEDDFYFGNGTGVSSSDLILDQELLNHILVSQWQSGTVGDFEQIRDGNGVW
jgi:hypothetical protein